MSDLIDRQAAIDALTSKMVSIPTAGGKDLMHDENRIREEDILVIKRLPSVEPKIIHCKDCRWWRQQTNYQGSPLSFGFCESDDMWRSLYGETYEVSHITTDDDFYCGYADMRYVRVVI